MPIQPSTKTAQAEGAPATAWLGSAGGSCPRGRESSSQAGAPSASFHLPQQQWADPWGSFFMPQGQDACLTR